MMTGESLTLGGCAPTPLASYLKAIGVLRLLSRGANHVGGRAADPDARGRWENERFHLTTRLSREDLRRFFLEKYAPSPIIAPWNGASGFYPKDNKDGLDPLTSNIVAKRFMHLAQAIDVASNLIGRRKLTQSPKEKENAKTEFVAELRSRVPDTALDWIDAALALSGDKVSYPQLLGTGGNDGHLDFTNNFMRRLVSKEKPLGLFDAATGEPSDDAPPLLENALFDAQVKGFNSAAVGQFAPGAAGGPNATAGFKGDGNVNPWDFVLMLEGAIAFAGAATRRHQGVMESGASFPFTVRMVGAGAGGVAAADEKDARAEFWAPLWRRPARFCEIDALFAEGRAILNGRTVSDGLNFARAVSRLGIARGFSDFERYGFLKRRGDAYLAAPVGRRSAKTSAAARLVADLDNGDWLARARRAGRGDGQPAAARSAIAQFEDALFELADTALPAARIRRALIALGEVCKWLASSRKGREAVREPPPAMSSAWIRMADDGSPEFRIAAALATLGVPPIERRGDGEAEASPGNEGATEGGAGAPKTPPAPLSAALPMAAHFAPIDERRFLESQLRFRRRAWSGDEAPPTVVWGAGGLVANMIAVLERRLVEGAIRGLEDKPLAGALPASLVDIGAFLSGAFDDARCAALLAGMVWVRPYRPRARAAASAASAPFAYAALKPAFAPDDALRRIGALPETARLPVPSGLVARLRAGGGDRDGRATDAAARAALTRARASGLVSPFESYRAETGHIGAGLRADRLAATLLVPIDDDELKTLVEHAFPGIFTEDSVESAEDANNDA